MHLGRQFRRICAWLQNVCTATEDFDAHLSGAVSRLKLPVTKGENQFLVAVILQNEFQVFIPKGDTVIHCVKNVFQAGNRLFRASILQHVCQRQIGDRSLVIVLSLVHQRSPVSRTNTVRLHHFVGLISPFVSIVSACTRCSKNGNKDRGILRNAVLLPKRSVIKSPR